jgi:LmbE family N-acetylglucosaminyl deacetylase
MTMTRKYPDLVSPGRFTRGAALVIAPHPDDEVAVCGGMLLHHADAGNPIEVVFLTDGARGSWRSEADPDYVAVREREAREACALQGAGEPRFLRFRDQELTADRALVGALRDILREVQPYVVYCPSFFEIHRDHHHAARALLQAVDGLPGAPLILFGEIGAPVYANVLVDITPVFERKIKALSCYQSQLSANDYVPPLKGLDQYRTVNIDMKQVVYAEAFLMGRAEELMGMASLVDQIATAAERAAERAEE